MKIRGGFVSNSSSSSFLLFNVPDLKTIDDLLTYLDFTEEITEDMMENIEFILLTIFKQRKKYSKKDVIQYLTDALELGDIPLFEKLFKWEFVEHYKFALTRYSSYVKEDKMELVYNLLDNVVAMDFIYYMWMYVPEIILKVCNERKNLTYPVDQGTQDEFSIKFKREYDSKTQICKILAENIYVKLEDLDMLKDLVIIDVGDDDNPSVESGYYFKNNENILRVSYH